MRNKKRIVRSAVYIKFALISLVVLIISCDMKPGVVFKENANPTPPEGKVDDAFSEDKENRDIIIFQLNKEESRKEKTYFKGIDAIDNTSGKGIESVIIKESGSIDSYYGIVLYKSDKEMESISLILINSRGEMMIGYFKGKEWFKVREYSGNVNLKVGLNQENRIRVIIQEEIVEIYINNSKEAEVTKKEINIRECDFWGVSAICNALGGIERISFKRERL